MASGDRKAMKARLTASAAERFLAPVRSKTVFARRSWFCVTLAAVLCVHAAVLVAFLRRDREATPPPQVAEIPVQVIVQPPQPPPQPAVPAQPPEKPATSAPRAANDEIVDRNRNDPDTHAPKAIKSADEAAEAQPAKAADAAEREPPPPDAQPDKTASAASSPTTDPTPPTPSERAPDVLQKDAEALATAAPEPPRRPADLAHATPRKTAPPKASRRELSALRQLAGSSALPDFTFAKPMRRHAKVTGGTEDDRYLAVIYGMITQNHALGSLPDGDWLVSVAFQVDGDGNLVGAGVTRSSGYPQIDLAALQAVERAAPFPPPPSGAMTGLVAHLHSADARAAAMSDDR